MIESGGGDVSQYKACGRSGASIRILDSVGYEKKLAARDVHGAVEKRVAPQFRYGGLRCSTIPLWRNALPHNSAFRDGKVT